MKKILSLILAMALFLTPVLALGEDLTDYQTYIDSNGKYTFSYPSSWTVISKDTFDALWTIAESNADESFKATMENVKPQVEQMGMVILMSADMVSNINIVRQELAGSTAELLLSLSDQLLASLQASMEGLEKTAEPSLVDIGNERQAMLLQYTYPMLGTQMYGVQAYVGTADAMYVFTLTTPEEALESSAEVMGFILGSSALN